MTDTPFSGGPIWLNYKKLTYNIFSLKSREGSGMVLHKHTLLFHDSLFINDTVIIAFGVKIT